MELSVESMLAFFRADNDKQEEILLSLPEQEAQFFLNQLNLVELNRMKLSFRSLTLKAYIEKAMRQ